MKYGSVAVAYKEGRFIGPHLDHLPNWIDEKIVLNSMVPWFGKSSKVRDDKTLTIAKEKADTVIRQTWLTEQDQRNTGQILHADKDWVIVLDPDEFLPKIDWNRLKVFLETTDADAVVCEGQHTYWKNGWVADPPKDYQQLIAVRPYVNFIDKRVVNSAYVVAPIWVHHFSWARTNEEVRRKITHYAHAKDFDTEKWFNEVWKKWKPGVQDVHPVTPDTLHDLVPAVLPPELEKLNLWPK